MKADKAIAKAWVREQGRASRSRTSSVMLVGLASTLVGIVQGWALATTLGAVLTHHTDHITGPIAVFAAACVVRVALTVIQDLAAAAAGEAARRRLRSEILSRIFAGGPRLLRRQHSSVIAAALVDRVDALDGYFSRWLPASSLWLVSQWIVVAAVLWANFQAGIILAVCCAFLPFFQAVFGIATGVASRRQFIAMGRLQTRFVDRVKGIATIVLSGAAEREAQALSVSADELRQRTMKVLRIAFLASATTDIAMVVALVAIVVTQSHHLRDVTSSSTAAHAIFAVLMVPEAFASFRALSAAYQDRAHATEAATAMNTLGMAVHTPEAIQTSSDAPHSELEVAAEHVSFHWDDALPPALEDVSFTLPAGETLVLEGQSGAGKSTLLELLLGFVSPTQGRILLGGVDITALSPRQISSRISWIGQRPVIFAGTIRDNILFGRPDATAEQLETAIRAAAMQRFVADLPHGLDTQIGEGGFGLSGGQVQRIAIARAWLKDAPLLLLDEPTSHLDPATESEILASLRALSKGRTVILCSHSAQTRDFGEHRLTLSRGRVVTRPGDAA